MLYNDEGTNQPETTDYNDIIVRRKGEKEYPGGSTVEIKMVLPTSIQGPLQANAGDVIRMVDTDADYSYRTVVRALVAHLPGF